VDKTLFNKLSPSNKLLYIPHIIKILVEESPKTHTLTHKANTFYITKRQQPVEQIQIQVETAQIWSEEEILKEFRKEI
jgi:hypothetical protein